MTLGEPSHNGHLSASLPTTTSAAPLQIRFPARSRKSAAQPVATDSEPNEDLQLAPAHQAVLHFSSPNHLNEQAFTVEDQDFDLFGPEDMQAAQQESNFDVTTAAVATSATLADVALGLGPSRPLSSAGSNAALENVDSTMAPAARISVLMQNAQDMLGRQQQEEATLRAAAFASTSALQEAQATAKHKQLAFEGYCHLPEMGSKEWYWTHKGQQRGPYSVAELFSMSQVARSVSPNQEIHNYYEEISTHIKYKLTEYKGLTAAWQQHQDSDTAVQQATLALIHAKEEVQAAMGRTAAAAAAVTAVVATEARWDWRPLDHSSSIEDSQGFTPSELVHHIASGRVQAGQDVFPVSEAGVPRPAGGVVQGWRDALSYAHQLAAADAAQPHAGSPLPAPADGSAPRLGLDTSTACWAYWDGQQQQGPFCLQDFQAWVSSGHFVDSMQVYHIEDTTTAHTLAQLFSQQACPQAPSEPQAPLPSLSDPTLRPNLAPNGVSAVPPTSSSQRYYQNHWQQEGLAPKAKVIAAQLREQLLESGKQAVYQLLKKSIYNSLPGLIKKARDDRTAEAAREAAEAARLESAVKAAAAKAAAEAARLKAEAQAKVREAALEKQRLEAEALAQWLRQEEEARLAAEAAAAAERQRREEAREEARRQKAEEQRIRQAAAAEAAAEAEAVRKAEAAAQQAWQEEHQRRKAQAAAKQLAAEEAAKLEAARVAAANAAAEKAAAAQAAAEKAAAEAVAREAAAKQAEEERAAAEQVRKLAAQMAADRLAAEQRAAAEAQAAAETQARAEVEKRSALRAKKAAQAQAMREARAANIAAEKERKETLKLARAERAAAAAAAKAAAKPAEAEAAEASAAEQEGPFADGDDKAYAEGLNGYAQHAQHTAGGADFRNGYHLLQPPMAQHQRKSAGFHAHSPTAGVDPEVDIMYSTPEKATAATAGGGSGAGPSPDVDIIHSASQEAQLKGSQQNPHHQLNNLQNTALQELDVDITHVSPFGPHGGQSRPQPRTAPGVESMLVSDALQSTQHQRQSSSADGMADQSEQIEEQRRSASASEPDFDWAAWQSPEDGPRGIAERLQRTRRPPKRPYSLPDIPKPKPKKQASKSTHHKLQHKREDRLLRQDSGSTSSDQFAQPRQHHTQCDRYQPHQPLRKASLPGNASSHAAAVAKKASRGKLKGRRVVEDVGCIRAAAYQGEAFMQARMDVLEQQGVVVQGNQAPADQDTGQQVMPHTVRVVGGKQRGHRSAVRDLSRDEAVTDASKWGLLKGRTQDLRFGRSRVHAWGLFAKKDIEPEEFIIEYVGQTIRTSLLDLREKAYEQSGLGSSYLFRIDESWAVDATRQGGLARFINHSCDPNCYTKIITVESHKHIVIYSKQHIQAGVELTYDYKFEYELTEEPIKCTCGATNCRGRLN